MEQEQTATPRDSGDVTVVRQGEKTILLVGTAHISQQSVELVEQIIEQEQPDTVCIELDEKRYEALSRPQRWENLNLREIIRKKQLSTLMANLVLSSYQKKLGGKVGIAPGSELLAAARVAEKNRIPISLCDRDVRVTLRRAWRATPFFKKSYLLASLLASIFDETELDEEKLAELRKKDVLSELLAEVGAAMPDAKRVLIDERDIYMAEKIKHASGERIVAVVGAGHLQGIEQRLREDNSAVLKEIEEIPKVSGAWKFVGWAVPVAILLALVTIGMQKGIGAAGENLGYWVLANGIPCALGAVLALAHPLTIFSAFAAAPLTSLTPVIGAGYVTAFIQVMYRPPVVREFELAGVDIGTVRGWWQNKLLRIFLVFLFTSFGSLIGTWVGGVRIFSNLSI